MKQQYFLQKLERHGRPAMENRRTMLESAAVGLLNDWRAKEITGGSAAAWQESGVALMPL